MVDSIFFFFCPCHNFFEICYWHRIHKLAYSFQKSIKCHRLNIRHVLFDVCQLHTVQSMLNSSPLTKLIRVIHHLPLCGYSKRELYPTTFTNPRLFHPPDIKWSREWKTEECQIGHFLYCRLLLPPSVDVSACPGEIN